LSQPSSTLTPPPRLSFVRIRARVETLPFDHCRFDFLHACIPFPSYCSCPKGVNSLRPYTFLLFPPLNQGILSTFSLFHLNVSIAQSAMVKLIVGAQIRVLPFPPSPTMSLLFSWYRFFASRTQVSFLFLRLLSLVISALLRTPPLSHSVPMEGCREICIYTGIRFSGFLRCSGPNILPSAPALSYVQVRQHPPSSAAAVPFRPQIFSSLEPFSPVPVPSFAPCGKYPRIDNVFVFYSPTYAAWYDKIFESVVPLVLSSFD